MIRSNFLAMGALLGCCAAAISPIASATGSKDGIHWVEASNGDIPRHAVSAGVDVNGKELYVCRITGAGDPASCTPYCNDMKTPGRLVKGEDFCAAEIRGPVQDTHYEVLVYKKPRWIPWWHDRFFYFGKWISRTEPRWVGPLDVPEMNNAILGGVEILTPGFYPPPALSPSPNLICRVVDKTDPENVIVHGLGKRVGEVRQCQYISSLDPNVSLNSDEFPNPDFADIVEFLIDPSKSDLNGN